MYFWDTDGNRYLDGVSSLWVNVHGHARPEIDAAIVDQRVGSTTQRSWASPMSRASDWREALLAVAPAGLSRVFYAGDGASAVEAALKIAYQAHAQNGAVRPLRARGRGLPRGHPRGS